MSIRFDAAGDQLSRTTTLPAITAFSIMAWVQVSVDRNAYSCFFHVGPVGFTYYYVGTSSDGVTIDLYAGGSDVLGSALPVGGWDHLALTVSGTTPIVYRNGVQVATTAAGAVTAGNIVFGNDSDGDWLNGRIAAIKIYGAVLTATEIQQEMRCYVPVRTANLNTWSPLLASTDVGNYAGTGAWTVGGTLTTEDGPPIAWSLRPGAMARRMSAPAAPALPWLWPSRTMTPAVQRAAFW